MILAYRRAKDAFEKRGRLSAADEGSLIIATGVSRPRLQTLQRVTTCVCMTPAKGESERMASTE